LPRPPFPVFVFNELAMY